MVWFSNTITLLIHTQFSTACGIRVVTKYNDIVLSVWCGGLFKKGWSLDKPSSNAHHIEPKPHRLSLIIPLSSFVLLRIGRNTCPLMSLFNRFREWHESETCHYDDGDDHVSAILFAVRESGSGTEREKKR